MVMAVATSSKACEEGSYESVDAGGCVKCKGKCDDQHEEDKASCKKACGMYNFPSFTIYFYNFVY